MKRWMLPALSVMIMLLLSACGGANDGPADTDPVDVDLEELANSLMESGLFEETLNQVDSGVAEMLYSVTNASASYIYAGSGAVADELALFEFTSNEEAQAAVPLAEDRVAAQKDSFATYIPEEVPKLDDAVIETYGRYMVVCVSGNADAGEIISGYF